MKKNFAPSVNHNEKTITLTKAYAQKANTPGTNEFRDLARLHKNFPDYDIVMRTAIITADKETYVGLSVERIEKIISRQDNSETLMREYNEFVALWGNEVNDKKNPGKKIVRAPYGKVKSWFLKKVRNHEIEYADVA